MLVKTDIPKLLLAGMRKEFMKEYDRVTPEWEKVALKVTSTKSVEPYAWLGAVTDLHEWIDERKPEALLEHDYSIKNLDWEGSISISKNAIDDEQYNQINLKVKQLASKARRFWGKMVFKFLSQGYLSTGLTGVFTGKDVTCYDGNPMFYATHEEGQSGEQTNHAQVAFSYDNFQAALLAMMGIKDDKAEEIDIHPNLLVVNQANMFAARQILNSTYYPLKETVANEPGPMAKNVMEGIVDLYVTPYVDPNDWFLFDTSGVIKPVILQIRKDIEFTSLIEGKDAFMRKQLYFGVDWRGMVGWVYGSMPMALAAIGNK